METNTNFERFFIEAVVKRIEALGMSHREFGMKLMGEHGARIWLRTRSPNDNEKARKLTLEEAYRIAEILHEDFPSLIWQVKQEMLLNQKKPD